MNVKRACIPLATAVCTRSMAKVYSNLEKNTKMIEFYDNDEDEQGTNLNQKSVAASFNNRELIIKKAIAIKLKKKQNNVFLHCIKIYMYIPFDFLQICFFNV